jgi:hypothetical protein
VEVTVTGEEVTASLGRSRSLGRRSRSLGRGSVEEEERAPGGDESERVKQLPQYVVR